MIAHCWKTMHFCAKADPPVTFSRFIIYAVPLLAGLVFINLKYFIFALLCLLIILSITKMNRRFSLLSWWL